ncbi:hypothetical protein ANANG_G00226440 [Anguilla anguilla]|uniref:Uncharacterized protein n=1 Tax=Anguilla anguilla TaxID=7936 RepID=A0A9D3RT69_ANGAN|nr:hypothetical protein ANANG_G00226440 [Anguilla anguilla]
MFGCCVEEVGGAHAENTGEAAAAEAERGAPPEGAVGALPQSLESRSGAAPQREGQTEQDRQDGCSALEGHCKEEETGSALLQGRSTAGQKDLIRRLWEVVPGEVLGCPGAEAGAARSPPAGQEETAGCVRRLAPAARAEGAAWALLERARKARLSRCLWRWREAVHRRSAWLRCLSRRRALSLSRCLQRWRHALELRRLSVAFITRASPRRRRRARGRRRELRWGVELWGESEPIASPQWRAHCSLDLLLHQAFHTWKDSTHNLQLARLAQQALDAQVHSFCTQLALLDSAPSLGSDSTPPICLFLGTSVGSEQALAVTERCSDRGEPVHGGAHPVYHSTKLGGRTPLLLAD